MRRRNRCDDIIRLIDDTLASIESTSERPAGMPSGPSRLRVRPEPQPAG